MHSCETVACDSNDIMRTLKASTWELHELAEHHPYQRAFVKGQLPRDAYVEYLGQMLLLHTALENRLAELQAATKFAEWLSPHHFRAPLLRDDIEFFGADPDSFRPGDATSALIREIEASWERDPFTALGFLYVLEGSTNGSKFIARSVERSLKLNPRQGTAYLNPHAELQTERWAEFKRAMGAQPFDEDQKARIVESAKAMFRGVIRLSDDLWHRLNEKSAPSRFESDRDDQRALETLGAAS